MLCMTVYQLYIFSDGYPAGYVMGAVRRTSRRLETVHKKFAIAPPHSPEHPWLDKLQSMFV